MGNIRLDSISDYYRHGYDLRVSCASGHVAMLNSLELSQECQHRRWSRRIERIELGLKCRNCGGRDIECGPTFRDE